MGTTIAAAALCGTVGWRFFVSMLLEQYLSPTVAVGGTLAGSLHHGATESLHHLHFILHQSFLVASVALAFRVHITAAGMNAVQVWCTRSIPAQWGKMPPSFPTVI